MNTFKINQNATLAENALELHKFLEQKYGKLYVISVNENKVVISKNSGLSYDNTEIMHIEKTIFGDIRFDNAIGNYTMCDKLNDFGFCGYGTQFGIVL